MKIEIDLNDILGDEYESETLSDSIKRQVVENIEKTLKKSVIDKINHDVSVKIEEAIDVAIVQKMDAIVDNVLTAVYQPVDRWGNKNGNETTFREALVKSINENMVYKKTNYDSDKNAFTKMIDSVISEQMKIISDDYKKTVNESIGKEAFNLAITTLKSKLGI